VVQNEEVTACCDRTVAFVPAIPDQLAIGDGVEGQPPHEPATHIINLQKSRSVT
jgi:hypothetical protein